MTPEAATASAESIDIRQLLSLSDLLRRAVVRADPLIYASTCEAVANHLELFACRSDASRGLAMLPVETLRKQLKIHVLGAARLLSLLLQSPGETVPAHDLMAACNWSRKALAVRASNLRSYLANRHLEHHFTGKSATGYGITVGLGDELAALIDHGGKDFGVLEYTLRRDLGLQSRGATRMLAALVSRADKVYSAHELCRDLACTQGSLKIFASYLRSDLLRYGLAERIVTVRRNAQLRRPGGYMFTRDGLPDLRRHLTFDLADYLDGPPGRTS